MAKKSQFLQMMKKAGDIKRRKLAQEEEVKPKSKVRSMAISMDKLEDAIEAGGVMSEGDIEDMESRSKGELINKLDRGEIKAKPKFKKELRSDIKDFLAGRRKKDED